MSRELEGVRAQHRPVAQERLVTGLVEARLKDVLDGGEGTRHVLVHEAKGGYSSDEGALAPPFWRLSCGAETPHHFDNGLGKCIAEWKKVRRQVSR